MAYQSIERIKKRISYRADQFDRDDPVVFFELLEFLEAESRALIESYMGDQTFEFEADRVDKRMSPDTTRLQLIHPVREIKKVEIRRFIGGDWVELDSDKFTFNKHMVRLRGFPRVWSRGPDRFVRYRHYRQNQAKITWKDISSEVRITYDRGYHEIPDNVLNIQISLINRVLRQLRMEQSISAIDPSDPTLESPFDNVYTDDILSRLDDITSFGRRTLVL